MTGKDAILRSVKIGSLELLWAAVAALVVSVDEVAMGVASVVAAVLEDVEVSVEDLVAAADMEEGATVVVLELELEPTMPMLRQTPRIPSRTLRHPAASPARQSTCAM
jgi:hypothetical protein